MDPRAVMDEMDREDMMKKFQESMTELEVLGENDRVLEKMDIEDAKGIDVRMRNAGGTFVYELRVPLASSEEQSYALGVDAGDNIGIGFLSPKLQMQRQRGVRGVGGMPGGRMGPYRPQQLKIWAKIQLAPGSSLKLQ